MEEAYRVTGRDGNISDHSVDNPTEAELVQAAVEDEVEEAIGSLVVSAPPGVDRDTALYALLAIREMHLHKPDSSVVLDEQTFRVIGDNLGEEGKKQLWEMIKVEQRHRHRREMAPFRIASLGTWLQFVLGLSLILVGALAIIRNQPEVGVAIFATGILAVGVVAGGRVWGRRGGEDENTSRSG